MITNGAVRIAIFVAVGLIATSARARQPARRLRFLQQRRKINHVYSSGGSEGNEAAIKMSRYFHYRNGQPERHWIIARYLAQG